MSFRNAIGFPGATAVCIAVAAVLMDGAGAEEPVPSASNPVGAEVAPSVGPDTSSGAADTPVARAEPAVVISEGRLTMVTPGRSLKWILGEVSREGRIAIMLRDGVGGEIYPVEFHDVPIEQALRQLLQGYDAFYFFNGGALQAVWVYLLDDGRGYEPVPPDAWASTLELQDQLGDPDPRARGSAISGLVDRQGDAAYDAVLGALDDESDEVRTRALYGAQTAGVKLPAELLSDMALSDPSEDVRFLALQALAGDPGLSAIAERALADPSPHIQNYARQILRRLHPPEGPIVPAQ